MSDRTRPTCPSCRIRFRVNPPPVRDSYRPWQVDGLAFAWIENAARDFDREAGGELFTASDFIAWIRPDVVEDAA